MRFFGIVLVLCAVFVSTAGCGEHHRFGDNPPVQYSSNHLAEPALLPGKYGGSISAAFLGDPKTFNLWVADDAESSDLAGELYDALEIRNSYTLKFEPRLAYLPKITDNGLVYTYTLRPGLKWSDGVPITADDIIFTLNLIFDPKIPCSLREVLLVDVPQPDGSSKPVPFRYKKIDSRTVQFTLPVQWAPAEEMFGFPIAPEHALAAAYKSGRFSSTWNINTPPTQLIASGPFVMASYVPSQRIIFKPNPYFWRYGAEHQHLPYLDEFRYLITPDTNAAVLTFRAGGTDALGVPLKEYPPIARYAHRDNYTMIDEGPSWGIPYLGFNENPASKCDKNLLSLFRQTKFRQAISYDIDRQRICDDVFSGLADPLYGPETPADTLYFDPNVQQYPYNPALAKKMLLQLGLREMADGMLSWRGKPVQFTLMTDTESEPAKEVITIVANGLRDLGLDVSAVPIAFNALIPRLNNPPYDWQAVVLAFTGGPEPNDGATIWRSTGPYHVWNPSQKTPATPWEAQIDEDFNEGARVLDIAKRRKYYDDFQEIVGKEQPISIICTAHHFTALRNHYGNIKPSTLGGLSGDIYWNLEEVYDTNAVRQTR